MPSAPPVGVVIANYNNGPFVGRAIESVARQSCRNLHTLVVDDASTDNSDEEIRACLSRLGDSRFDYVRLDANVGQTGAIKRGLARLDTPFVGFLDSDDVWYENFIERHLCVHMNADFPVSLTYCDSHIIDADDHLLAGTAWWFEHAAARDGGIDSAMVPTFDAAAGGFPFPERASDLSSAMDGAHRHEQHGEHDVPAQLRRSGARGPGPGPAALSTTTSRRWPAC